MQWESFNGQGFPLPVQISDLRSGDVMSFGSQLTLQQARIRGVRTSGGASLLHRDLGPVGTRMRGESNGDTGEPGHVQHPKQTRIGRDYLKLRLLHD